MVSFIIFFLLFFLPFIIAPFGVTQFENPKVIFGEVGIIVLFLACLFGNRLSFKNRSTQILLSIVVILLTVIDLLFFRTQISLFGNVFRMQGIFLLWMLLIFSFISAASLREGTTKQSLQFSEKIAALTLAMTKKWWIYAGLLYGELIATFFLPLNASHRYVGTLGEPNALAAFAIFVWPFGWFAIRNTSKKWIERILLLVPVVLLLYLSDSRSGMIGFGIEMLFVVLTHPNPPLSGREQSQKSQEYRVGSVKKAVFICLLFYFFSYSLPFLEHDPYENRVQVWESALYAGMINPGLGQGFGNTEIALHNGAAGLDLPIQYYYVDSSHNIFLDWWVQGGFVGLIVLGSFVYGSMHSFIRHKRERELVLLLGMLTVLSFNPASMVSLLGFWWLIGQGL